MSEESDKALQAIGTAALILPAIVLFVIPIFLLDAWAFTLVWGWFVVPLDIAPLSYATAMGLRILVRLMSQGGHVKEEYLDPPLKRLGAELSGTLMLLVTAWLIHWWTT